MNTFLAKTFLIRNFLTSLLVVIPLAIVGCAGFPTSMPYSGMMPQNYYPSMISQNLYSAGFVPMPMNACAPGFFETLPPNQITTIQRNGNNYYVYADQSSHQVFIGQSSAFKNYRALVNRQLPAVTSAGQRAEKKFTGIAAPQCSSLGTFEREAKNSWKKIIHKYHAAPTASNNEPSASEPNISTAHPFPSSGQIKKQAQRKLKQVGF